MANIQSAKRQIKGEIYGALRDALVKPQKNKKSWADNFIQLMLNEAKSNPTGALGQMIAKQLLQDDVISNLDSETEKLLARDKDFLEYRVYKQCYKEQRDVLLDTTSKYILVNTGRRTGKTNLAARWLVKKCVTPNSPCFYIHLKMDNAIRQCFDLCLEAAKLAELAVENSSKNTGVIQFCNGSSISFKGNSNKSEADKIRGFKARGIVIDEAAFQINMNYLINDILTPMMADYNDSQMLLVSTPPRIPHTYYENCYRSNKWTIYEWYANKNPFIPSFDAFIQELCEKKGLTMDSAFIQREGFGKFIYDTEAMVFKSPLYYKEIESEEPNAYVKQLIKEGKFHADFIYGGIDWGGTDYNAIVTVAWDKKQNIGYILRHFKFNQSTATEIIEKCKMSLEEAQDILALSGTELNKVAYYADHNVKSLVFELQNNYNFPIQLAYKRDKISSLQILADLLRTHIYTPENSPLSDEYEQTVYKRDEETDAILPEIDEVYHADAADALLYLSRAIVQFENPLGESLSIKEEKEIEKERIPDDEQDFVELGA